METNCLLELPMGEGSGILSEVNLKPSIQSAETTDNDVSGILLDNPVENHGGSSYNTSGIDFEFVNSELGSGSAYTMDHSSVFDISEPVIEEKSELFRDSEVFDDCLVKHNDIDKQQNSNLDLQSGRKLIMDLGLKLQIIPLNNLKFVSTIQTSEGVHIVALPDNSSISQKSDPDQPLIRDIFPQLNSTQIRMPGDGEGRVGRSKGVFDVSTPQMKRTDVLKVIQLKCPNSETQNESQQNISCSEHDNKSSKINLAHTLGSFQSDPESPSVRHLLKMQKETLDKSKTVVLSSEHSEQLNIHACAQKLKRQKKELSKTLKNISYEAVSSKKSGKSLKESKIIIDLRKLMPQRKSRRMVSLLSSPKTNKLYANKGLKVDPKSLSNTTIQPCDKNSKTGKEFLVDTCTYNLFPKGISKTSCDRSKDKVVGDKTDMNDSKQNLTDHHVEDINSGNSRLQENIAVDIKKSSKAVQRKDVRYHCRLCKAEFIRLGNYKNHTALHTTRKNCDQHVPIVKQLCDEVSEMSQRTGKNKSTCKETEFLKDVETECEDHIAPADNSFNVIPNMNEEMFPLETSTDRNEALRNTTLEKVKHDHHELSVEMLGDGKPVDRTTQMLFDSEVNSDKETVDDEQYTNEGLDDHGKIKANADCGKKVKLHCYICQLSFSSEGNLTRHKLTHMKSGGRYTCTVCKKCFHQQCDLKRHQMIHSGQLPFSCEVCCKGFLRKSDLAGHKKFHSKEKTYKCDQCSKSYFQLGDLQRHIRQSHADLCQFTCQYCSKKYTAERSLFTHVRSKHKQHSV